MIKIHSQSGSRQYGGFFLIYITISTQKCSVYSLIELYGKNIVLSTLDQECDNASFVA
jgi:hypothetical protein